MSISQRFPFKFASGLLAGVLSAGACFDALAALASNPPWYDFSLIAADQNWHYRVPVTLPAGSAVNHVAVVNLDFNDLLSRMGVSGTLDPNSVRVIRPNGAYVSNQGFTPSVYADATNTVSGRGELRFVVPEASGTYQVYFDILENGAKPAPFSGGVNGNFEASAAGATQPAGWSIPTVVAGFDGQVRPSEMPSISTNGTPVGNGTSPRTVDGTPRTGQKSYLLGARTNNEPSAAAPSSQLIKVFTVPATNPGVLKFRYRIQGWGGGAVNTTTGSDYFTATIKSGSVSAIQMVGPSATATYVTYPYSPNYRTSKASASASGYGQYNGWDTDTGGTRRGAPSTNTTFTRGAEPWFEVTQSLSAFAGQSVTLTFAMNNNHLTFKTWAHLDDVEWSVINPTVGEPVGAGVQANQPSASSGISAGDLVSISATVDALPASAVFADILDAGGTVLASNVRLFNDGTHGSSVDTPNVWVNDGSDAAYPTYKVPPNAASATWTLRIKVPDGSTSSLVPARNGYFRRPNTTAADLTEAVFFNIDDESFTVTGTSAPILTHIKSVSIYSDPVNGQTNPKAIPGAKVTYSMTIGNSGAGAVDASTVVLTDPIPANTKMCLGDFASPGQGPVSFVNGATASGLTYTFSGLSSSGDSLSFSKDAGSSFTYTPVLDADGCDAAITHVRIAPSGVMLGSTGPSVTPSFTASFRVQIK